LHVAAFGQLAQGADLWAVLHRAEQLHVSARAAEAVPGGAEVDVPAGFHR
jgi:hypothetical protein